MASDGADIVIDASATNSENTGTNTLSFANVSGTGVTFDIGDNTGDPQPVDGDLGDTVALLTGSVPSVTGSPQNDTLSNSQSGTSNDMVAPLSFDGGGGKDTVKNTGDYVRSISAADFSSLTNSGDDVGAIDVSGANFSSLQNDGDDAQKIDVSGAQFSSLVNNGDGDSSSPTVIDISGANFSSLQNTGDDANIIDTTGADFGSLVNTGQNDTIDVMGANFNSPHFQRR